MYFQRKFINKLGLRQTINNDSKITFVKFLILFCFFLIYFIASLSGFHQFF